MIKILDTLAKPKTSTTSLVKMLTSQPLSNSVWTKAIYGTVVFDEIGCWDSTNNRFVIPSGIVSAKVYSSVYWAINSTNGRFCEVRKNGTSTYSGVARNLIQAYTDTHQGCFSAMLSVTQGDYFESWAMQNSGTSLSLDGSTDFARVCNWFQIEMFYK